LSIFFLLTLDLWQKLLFPEKVEKVVEKRTTMLYIIIDKLFIPSGRKFSRRRKEWT